MMSGFPIVTARTCLMSSGRRQGSAPSLPITLLRSTATTNAMRLTPRSARGALDRHLGFDRRMELVLPETRDGIEQRPRFLARARATEDLVVAGDDVVETPQARVEREARRRVWLATELLPRAVQVIPVDVRVGQHVRELVGHEIGELSDQVQEDRVLRDIERHA